MSALSNVLEDYFKTPGVTQLAFAQQHDLDRGTLNRAVRGSVTIGSDAARRIIAALPAEIQPRATAGWLLDQTPSQLRQLISVLPNSEPLRETRELPSELRAELRRAFLWLSDAALVHGEIDDLIMSLFRAFTSHRSDETMNKTPSSVVTRNANVENDRITRAADGMARLARTSPATLRMMEEHLRLSGQPHSPPSTNAPDRSAS